MQLSIPDLMVNVEWTLFGQLPMKWEFVWMVTFTRLVFIKQITGNVNMKIADKSQMDG
jgi:hypothetical protein